MCSISHRLSVLKRQLKASKFSKDFYPLMAKWSFPFASALVNWIFAKGEKSLQCISVVSHCQCSQLLNIVSILELNCANCALIEKNYRSWLIFRRCQCNLESNNFIKQSALKSLLEPWVDTIKGYDFSITVRIRIKRCSSNYTVKKITRIIFKERKS